MSDSGRLKHVVKPVEGECLSSWLSRNSTCPHIAWAHSDFLASCRALARLRVGGDLDRLYEVEHLGTLLPIPFDSLSVGRFQLPENLSSVGLSLKYCPQCLIDDILEKRSPAWRVAWRQIGVCLCTKHDRLVLLQQISLNAEEQFHRAWLALAGHLSSGQFIFGNHFIQRLHALCDSNPAEQKLCLLVLRAVRWVNERGTFPTYGRPSFECLRFLMGYFLYRPFPYCRGGLGRWFLGAQEVNGASLTEFRYPRAKEMASSIEMATPKQLAISYLFIGIAYDIYEENEINMIIKALSFTNSPFPSCRSELRALARCFQISKIEGFRRYAFNVLHAGDLSHLDWLLGDAR